MALVSSTNARLEQIAHLDTCRIFILEGLLPVLASPCIFFFLPDKPATASFLTPEERKFVIHRIQIETGSAAGKVTNEDPLRKRYIIAAFKEWKIWMSLFIYWGNSVAVIGQVTSHIP